MDCQATRRETSLVGFRDAESLFFLKDILPNFAAGLIIYNGPEILTLGKDIYAVPWAML